ncbi:murein hydrolase activator EnvC family protein [Marinagarivorans cellulosilyticus]|uniref:Murein hydrolase activator n=1 Tax=Marinagarivorans cellulosilyticus TaxID=2721545 RepID=A0AAN1WHT7_9GAMM|nr:peptidoglycan DD-metalloendopeptidase family protein [Marinagarivorans cellulosilyticus]BCD97873.1 murein hydrolase activator [Marinagarivorans cellulosilyticus]
MRLHSPHALVIWRFKARACTRILLAITLAVITPSLLAQDKDPRQAKLDELRAVINQLKGELDGVKDERDDLLKNLEKSESKIGELNKKAKELEQKIDNNQVQLLDLRREKEALASVKKQQQRQVTEQVNTAYRLGQQSHLKLLLNQRDAALVARNLKYFDYIAAARAEQIAAANHTIERLSRIEPEMAAEQTKLARNSKSLREQQQALKAQFKERKQTLKKLEQTIATKDQQLKASEKDQKRLQNLIERVVRVAGDIDAPVNTQKITSLKGQLPWPTKGPVRHSYNSQRVSGKVRWQGMLIGAPADSPVKAVHHGRVVFADYLRGHGLLVIVDHGHGMLSLYAHNKTLYKTLGEWVNAGEIIAAVGNSGGQAQAGLYFELRKNGTPTNPHHWLKKSA